MSGDEFRSAGHALIERIAEFLESLPGRPLTTGESPAQIRAHLHADAVLPESGEDADALLPAAADLLFDHSLFNGHPRFFGYITAPPAHVGILGDMLAAAVNPNVGAWKLSPVASEIEAQCVRWIAELLGFPTTCGGLMVSGGNMANFVGFFAARAAAADWDVRRLGLQDGAARRLRVYASAETHTWIQKAADLGGLGTDSIRWIPVDRQLRMDLDALRRSVDGDLAAGDQPMAVVGTAGSVSTGVVDPLDELAGLCAEYGIWFHVDGAYGGFAAMVPDQASLFTGIEHADSIAVDPHKWLYAPLEAGCALVRLPDRLRQAFAYSPPYYHFGIEANNYNEFGPQNSRGFRALKVWLALRQAGRSGYVRMISDDITLSRRLHAAVEAHPELEPFTQALSINTFRFVPADLKARTQEAGVSRYLDTLNRELLARLEAGGEAFVSNAVVDGRFALRACIVNFNTETHDVDAMPSIIVRIGRSADVALRQNELVPAL